MELSRTPTPKFLPRMTRWIVGADLGQSSDPTALCAIEHIKGVLDSGSDFERHISMTASLQTPAEIFNVRHLERLPLGTTYPAVINHIRNLLARPPLCGDADHRPAELVIDSSGVGRAVFDMFVAANMKPIGITITGGMDSKWAGPNRYHVSKDDLMTRLSAMLHEVGKLRFASALTESHALKDELKEFQRHVGAAGRTTYAAREGKHDDLVLAVAIAAWWASRPPPATASWGHY
jgi:hypothetical protein